MPAAQPRIFRLLLSNVATLLLWSVCDEIVTCVSNAIDLITNELVSSLNGDVTALTHYVNM